DGPEVGRLLGDGVGLPGDGVGERAIAVGRYDGGHARRLARDDVALVVADVDATDGRAARLPGGVQQGLGVRLGVRGGVAADRDRAAGFEPEVADDRPRQVFDLVGHDTP